MPTIQNNCPECGSTNFIDTVRAECCRDCGYHFYYGDATAPPGSRASLSSNHWKELDRKQEGGK
jgi:transcription initiation factor TFIIIB Brf1 subunit/transcription initiation factor TFIIB